MTLYVSTSEAEFELSFHGCLKLLDSNSSLLSSETLRHFKDSLSIISVFWIMTSELSGHHFQNHMLQLANY